MSEEAATQVAADSRVAAVEPDRVVSLAAQRCRTGIDRVEADMSSSTHAQTGAERSMSTSRSSTPASQRTPT